MSAGHGDAWADMLGIDRSVQQLLFWTISQAFQLNHEMASLSLGMQSCSSSRLFLNQTMGNLGRKRQYMWIELISDSSNS